MIAAPPTFDGCEPKVADLDGIVVLVKEDVVRFQITMNDVLGVEIVHALSRLTGNVY